MILNALFMLENELEGTLYVTERRFLSGDKYFMRVTMEMWQPQTNEGLESLQQYYSKSDFKK